jgi:hypothetical protein
MTPLGLDAGLISLIATTFGSLSLKGANDDGNNDFLFMRTLATS